jgi:hypothetical protein
MLVERECFELAEVADELGLKDPVIRELVWSGKLRICIRLVSQKVERYYWEEVDHNEHVYVPLGKKWVNTLAQLSTADAYRLVRSGEVVACTVELPEGVFAELREGDGLRLGKVDALVTRANLQALRHNVSKIVEAERKVDIDFRYFEFNGMTFSFSHTQAKALKYMNEQDRKGVSELQYLEILDAAGSSSQRMASLFSRHPGWKRLLVIVPGRRGYYKLAPDFRDWLRLVSL